jgi:N-hydroxyarylamine O-acetyltransferase
MDIGAYLRRIGYDGPTRPSLETLRGVQRAHSTAIPYETFDIFLGRRIVTDPEAAFEKLVGRSRGGWCYEHNGLLGLALAAMGFEVARLTAGGDQPATHLALRVEAPDAGAFVCDPGFSDAPLDPFPLVDGAFEQNGFVYRLERLDEARFRFVNHPLGLAPGYEAGPGDEAAMAAASDWLQTSPESRFIHAPVACIHEPDGAVKALVARTLRTVRPDRVDSLLVESASQYVEILEGVFKLRLPVAADLWPAIVRRHEDYQRAKAEAAAAEAAAGG